MLRYVLDDWVRTRTPVAVEVGEAAAAGVLERLMIPPALGPALSGVAPFVYDQLVG